MKREQLISGLARRDGFLCHYCDVPLADKEDSSTCYEHPPLTKPGGHCGCGNGSFGEDGDICTGCSNCEPCICSKEGFEWPEVDHFNPRSKGGSDSMENLRLSCSGCNTKKGNRYPWIAPNGRKVGE